MSALTVNEIAQRFDCPPATVSTRLRIAGVKSVGVRPLTQSNGAFREVKTYDPAQAGAAMRGVKSSVSYKEATDRSGSGGSTLIPAELVCRRLGIKRVTLYGRLKAMGLKTVPNRKKQACLRKADYDAMKARYKQRKSPTRKTKTEVRKTKANVEKTKAPKANGNGKAKGNGLATTLVQLVSAVEALRTIMDTAGLPELELNGLDVKRVRK